MPLLLAVASDHSLDVAALAVALAFGIGSYGHVIHSRTLILTAIFAIGVICIYFVATGEVQTFGASAVSRPSVPVGPRHAQDTVSVPDVVA